MRNLVSSFSDFSELERGQKCEKSGRDFFLLGIFYEFLWVISLRDISSQKCLLKLEKSRLLVSLVGARGKAGFSRL